MPDAVENRGLTVLILTLNEERHIRRCIVSVRPVADRIVVVDSGSSDATREVAAEMGADVYINPFVNYATQFNWGLDNTGITTEWVMRLDADEYVTSELAESLTQILRQTGEKVVGFTLNLRRVFMGRWLRRGALYPIRLLRVWRTGRGRCEDRWMDEHVVVSGSVAHLDLDFVDENLNHISWWTDKHNKYASREAVDLLVHKHSETSRPHGSRGSRQASAKRWIKQRIYAHMPLGVRSMSYFLYRYVVRLGMLDGWQGFIFHFLQAWWYRMLVDVKVYEVECVMRARGATLESAVRDVLGLELPGSSAS